MFGRATIMLGIGPHSSFVLFARTHGSKESYFEQKLCINSCLASARTTVIAFNNELLADTTQRLKH